MLESQTYAQRLWDSHGFRGQYLAKTKALNKELLNEQLPRWVQILQPDHLRLYHACWLCHLGPVPNLSEPHRAMARMSQRHAGKETAYVTWCSRNGGSCDKGESPPAPGRLVST